MELAIPFIVLGGLYNIKKNKNTMNKQRCESYINKHNLLNQSTSVVDDLDVNDINRYENPNNEFTDKYYSNKNTETVSYDIKSMTGNTVNSTEFNHNNMMPYFGKSKLNGNSFMENAPTDSILDSMQGNNSYSQDKEEMAPLFKPEENIQWAHGSPNQTDFMRNRQNVGMVANNINPWKENVQITPGLNKNYNDNSNLGYNAGVESRNSWIPKTVDELRAASNPKLSYELGGREGPAQSKIQERGIHGKFEKHLPDRFYVNDPNRYLTTTGLQKAPTVRSLHNNRNVSRAVSVEYTGAPNMVVDSGKTESNYRIGNKAFKQLSGPTMGIAQTNGGGYVISEDGTFIPDNNRTTTLSNERNGLVSGVVSTVAAPLMDILKPTRKEDLVNSVRVNGQAGPGSHVPSNRFFDPKDKVKTTTKETTQYSPFNYGSHSANYNPQGAYETTQQQCVSNQRDTTSVNYMGNANNATQLQSYESNYNQTSNSNRSNTMAMNHGNTNMFNNNINQSANNSKSSMSVQYTPNVNGNLTSSIPSAQTYGKLHVSPYENKASNNIDGNILKAFKNNPYTHSLASVA